MLMLDPIALRRPTPLRRTNMPRTHRHPHTAQAAHTLAHELTDMLQPLKRDARHVRALCMHARRTRLPMNASHRRPRSKGPKPRPSQTHAHMQPCHDTPKLTAEWHTLGPVTYAEDQTPPPTMHHRTTAWRLSEEMRPAPGLHACPTPTPLPHGLAKTRTPHPPASHRGPRSPQDYNSLHPGRHRTRARNGCLPGALSSKVLP